MHKIWNTKKCGLSFWPDLPIGEKKSKIHQQFHALRSPKDRRTSTRWIPNRVENNRSGRMIDNFITRPRCYKNVYICVNQF